MKRFDLAVVGSGFGGSLLALVARRLGRSVVLLEKDAHPRFAIGESTSPIANLLLERIARRYDLPRVLPLARWGTWQDETPHLRGGVKRGFTFFHHRRGLEPAGDGDLRNPLLVAASPSARVADTHWYRADVDLHLLEQAREAGAEYVDRIALDAFERDGKFARLSGRRGAERVSVEARFVADASGPRGFVHRMLRLGESDFPGLPRAATLYGHFRGVATMAETAPLSEAPPYPVDDAALHHVFAGGWIWVLRFCDGTVSAGAMLSPELAREVQAPQGEPAWRRLAAMFPAIERQFRRAEAVFPMRYAENAAFRTTAATGPGWWMLPSAAAFVDPLLSTGIPLTLLGVARAGEALESADDEGFSRALAGLADRTLAEADAAAALVAALWRTFDDFPAFCAATMLYFASASFAEASCRLGRGGLPGFLGSDRPELARAIALALSAVEARPSPAALGDSIRRAIEPWNVAGLLDPERQNWYPVRASDLRAGAEKLGASERDVEALLARSGFGTIA